jgi:hypothetical protein
MSDAQQQPPQQLQVPSDLPLTVTLPAVQWQRVMNQLGEGAIKTIGQAYGEIDRQLQIQVQQQMQAQPKLNGEDRPHA